jgi:hypothetical protein
MVSSTTKFRLTVAGSLICVVGLALLYKFKEEAAGKTPETPQIAASDRAESVSDGPGAGDLSPTLSARIETPSAFQTVADALSPVVPVSFEASRIEYRPPPMLLYPGTGEANR